MPSVSHGWSGQLRVWAVVLTVRQTARAGECRPRWSCSFIYFIHSWLYVHIIRGWRDGLYYKLIFDHKISTKFVSIIRSFIWQHFQLCETIRGCQWANWHIYWPRQGCNLSPYLFNLYVNDMNLILDKADISPVSLNKSNVSSLMYVDDLLILTRSESGMQKALDVLDVYCHKWHLVVNINKTKMIVFNKRKQLT